MNQETWRDFEARCQKPDHRRIGNFMARWIARPMALRITWVVAPWGVSAHAATFAALAVALAAAGAFAWGTPLAWLIAAVVFQAWYLLDHVDGQLARFARRETLDGAALDYLMHHVVNVVIPLGVGWGVVRATGNSFWQLAGTAWGISLLLMGLRHDVRHKAFIKRLKRLDGELRVVGGGGGKPSAQPPIPRGLVRFAAWFLRKSAEIHVVMNLASLAGALAWAFGDRWLVVGQVLLAVLAPTAMLASGAMIIRDLRHEAAEREFAAWYRPEAGKALEVRNGEWKVVSVDREHGAGAPFVSS